MIPNKNILQLDKDSMFVPEHALVWIDRDPQMLFHEQKTYDQLELQMWV